MILTIIFIIILIYILLIWWLNLGFDKVEDFKLQDLPNTTPFSVIIPFRNEEKNLPQLLGSILKLNYKTPLFEVIFVNDDSEDESTKIINKHLQSSKIHFKIIDSLRTSNSPKKDAISTAIRIAQNNWIITTDADCVLPKYWLDTFDEFIQIKDTIAIAGPVKFTGPTSFFTRFQILDTLSLQSATIGGFGIHKPFMCNGANFAYKKSVFKLVKGFDGNDSVASGDDVFLLQKFIKTYPNDVYYLKSSKSIVSTQVVSSIKDFINQRVRWTSKSSRYKSLFPKIIGLIVLITNFLLVSLLALLSLNLITAKTVGLIWLIKISIDLLPIFKTARFFKQEHILLSYIFVSLLYPFVTVYIALLIPLGTYNWKGRTFKN